MLGDAPLGTAPGTEMEIVWLSVTTVKIRTINVRKLSTASIAEIY